jgi:hypothetical protein
MIIYLAIGVIGIFWIMLPFAVFGIKDQLKEINKTLKAIAKEERRQSPTLRED